MRKSKQRDLILEIINSSHSHPNTYEIYEEARKSIPNISLGTVYRNIEILKKENLITKIEGEDDMVHYDNVFTNHSHFVCTKCKQIYDIKDEIIKEKTIEGNLILSYNFKYIGICNECLKKEDYYGIKRI